MKNSEVNNKNKNKDGNFKNILSIWSFKSKIFSYVILTKQKSRLCEYGGIQQWGVNYKGTYVPVVNWISVRLLLSMASIYGFPSISNDFVLDFLQDELDVDVFMGITLGMKVYAKRGEWVLKLNASK